MARYRGPVCRLCRREGNKLFLKGQRCLSEKCSLNRRSTPPGLQVAGRRRDISDYGLQLREKQKVRRIYGLLERQFYNYFKKAERMEGMTGENLLCLLERRLDNVIYRLGWATSRAQARQLANHRHILVNGRVVDIPSVILQKGDSIGLNSQKKNEALIRRSLALKRNQDFPSWLKMDKETLKANVISLPSREDIEYGVDEELIVAFYSR